MPVLCRLNINLGGWFPIPLTVRSANQLTVTALTLCQKRLDTPAVNFWQESFIYYSIFSSPLDEFKRMYTSSSCKRNPHIESGIALRIRQCNLPHVKWVLPPTSVRHAWHLANLILLLIIKSFEVFNINWRYCESDNFLKVCFLKMSFIYIYFRFIITWRRSGWKSMLQKATDSLFDPQKCYISWPLTYWVYWQVHCLAGRSHVHFLHYVNLKESDARIFRVCLFWTCVIRQEDGCNYSCCTDGKNEEGLSRVFGRGESLFWNFPRFRPVRQSNKE